MDKSFSLISTDKGKKQKQIEMTYGEDKKIVNIDIIDIDNEAEVFRAFCREFAKYSDEIEKTKKIN